jgi:hypothetical protein
MPRKKPELTNRQREDLQVAAIHEAVHAAFFNREPINVREVRERLDPVLKTQAIREIMKLDLSDRGDGDDTAYN